MFDELECIGNLKRGSYKAFTQIYDEYADSIFSFALRQLRNRNAARDVVQDTFMKLWINRNMIDCSRNLKSFIFSIARYRIIDTLRRQMREPKFEEYIEHCAEDPTDVSPEDIIMYEEFLSLVTMAKEKLTPRERQIYELSRTNREKSSFCSSSHFTRSIGRLSAHIHFLALTNYTFII